MMRSLGALIKDRTASSAAEAAILVPVLLALVCGSLEAYECYRAQIKVTNAAQTIADLVVNKSTVAATDLADFCVAAKLVMAPYATTTLAAAVASVTNISGTVTADWQDTSCGGATSISGLTTMAQGQVPNAGNSVIVVQLTYTYANPIHFVLSSSFAMSSVAYANTRNGSSVTKS